MWHVKTFAGFLEAQPTVIEDHCPEAAEFHGSMGAAHILVAIDHRDLADDRLHTRIGGGQDQSVSTGVGNTPDSEPIRIYGLVSFEKRKRILVVANLCPRVEVLPIVTLAVAKVAIVENHRVDSGFREGLCIGRHDNAAHVAPATSQNHS